MANKSKKSVQLGETTDGITLNEYLRMTGREDKANLINPGNANPIKGLSIDEFVKESERPQADGTIIDDPRGGYTSYHDRVGEDGTVRHMVSEYDSSWDGFPSSEKEESESARWRRYLE